MNISAHAPAMACGLSNTSVSQEAIGVLAFGISIRGVGHEGAAFGILAYAPAMSVDFSMPRFRKKQSEWLRLVLALTGSATKMPPSVNSIAR